MRHALWMGALAFSFSLQAAEVLRVSPTGDSISVRFDPNTRYRVGDYVCVIQEGVEVACGKVGLASENTAIVPLQYNDALLARGDRVELGKTPGNSGLVPESYSETFESAGDYHELYRSMFYGGAVANHDPKTSATRALSVGTISLCPGLHYQSSVKDKWIGGIFGGTLLLTELNPMFRSAITEGVLLGGHLTATHYSDSLSEGYSFMMGLGGFMGNANHGGGRAGTTALSAFAALGKRWRLDDSFWGFAFGFQYIHLSWNGSFPRPEIDIYAPALVIDMGWML